MESYEALLVNQKIWPLNIFRGWFLVKVSPLHVSLLFLKILIWFSFCQRVWCSSVFLKENGNLIACPRGFRGELLHATLQNWHLLLVHLKSLIVFPQSPAWLHQWVSKFFGFYCLAYLWNHPFRWNLLVTIRVLVFFLGLGNEMIFYHYPCRLTSHWTGFEDLGRFDVTSAFLYQQMYRLHHYEPAVSLNLGCQLTDSSQHD